jgi:hypothetical protein
MAKHNKKRNVGLLYEQLLRFASNCLVERDNTTADESLNILYKNFKPGSALYREFRLFNALVHTRVDASETARMIISESKSACRQHDANQLRKEKSTLIKEINHGLNDRDFYNQHFDNYKVFATVQALLNEWRGARSLGPEDVVKYEMVLEKWLTRPVAEKSSIKKEHANPLTFKIMLNKFKNKYADKMNDRQTRLFELFLYGKDAEVVAEITDIKNKSRKIMKSYFSNCDNRVLNSKRSIVEGNIENVAESSDLGSVSRALVLLSLTSEMEASND